MRIDNSDDFTAAGSPDPQHLPTARPSLPLFGRTLKLEEAAAFLHMHPEEVRTRAKRGIIPGAKTGRRWVFLEVDLASFVRSLYPVRRQALQVTSDKEVTCHYADARESGGSTSTVPEDSGYADLLGLATKPSRKNSTTS